MFIELPVVILTIQIRVVFMNANILDNLTEHAMEQARRRGISPIHVQLLYQYGAEKFDNHGCIIRYFNKNNFKRLLGNDYEKYKDIMQDHLNIYLVESLTGLIITVGHQIKRRKDKPAQKYSEAYHLKKHFSII